MCNIWLTMLWKRFRNGFKQCMCNWSWSICPLKTKYIDKNLDEINFSIKTKIFDVKSLTLTNSLKIPFLGSLALSNTHIRNSSAKYLSNQLSNSHGLSNIHHDILLWLSNQLDVVHIFGKFVAVFYKIVVLTFLKSWKEHK